MGEVVGLQLGKASQLPDRTRSPTMAISLEPLDVVDEQGEFAAHDNHIPTGSLKFDENNISSLASPLHGSRQRPLQSSHMSNHSRSHESLGGGGNRKVCGGDDLEESVLRGTLSDIPAQVESRGRSSSVKGVIFKEREAREIALLKALIKLGKLDLAKNKISTMAEQGLYVPNSIHDMLHNATGENNWRSPWTPLKRAIIRRESKRELVKELKDGNTHLEQVRAEEQRTAEFQAQWRTDREKLRRQMKDFTMWQIYLIVPWKDAKVVLDVDSDFTLWRVKKMIHESEGVSVEQQKLWVIRRVPQRPNKSPAALAAEQAAAARTAALLRKSAMGMIREAGLANPNQNKSRLRNKRGVKSPRSGSQPAPLQPSIKPLAAVQSPRPASSHFSSREHSPMAASRREHETPSPFSQNNPFLSVNQESRTGHWDPKGRHGPGSPLRGSPLRGPMRMTRWDALGHIKSTKKQWAALADQHLGSPRVLKVPKRQASLKRVAVNPVDYQSIAHMKVELHGDDRLLTALGIRAGDTLQVGIDEHATKLKQRQAVLKELGQLTGDDMEQKVVAAFHRFDIDNSGTIELRELGLSMMSLGIYLSDHELSALARQFDDDGNGHFDLPEFHEMLLKILHGSLDEFGATKW